jgi:hypothetical protein
LPHEGGGSERQGDPTRLAPVYRERQRVSADVEAELKRSLT